ncbi:MAG: DUF1730 domain-containing protein [Clostridia bacterium]|nr:DUF1730 domain-containing protein [Clostridia bacterium]
MLDKIKEFLGSYKIEYIGVIPVENCRIINRSLFARSVSFAKNAVVFLIPYKTSCPENHRISLYAAAKDYHGFTKRIFDDVCPRLEALYPNFRFHGMCDHSPIDETHAAASVGLGVIGNNGRLISGKYGSYVFIGEIYTDAAIEPSEIINPPGCISCGRCKTACPTGFEGECLSAITQKKGELTYMQANLMRKYGVLWGCDKCQEVCPMNEGKELSEIDYFKEDLIFDLDENLLSSMPDKEFAKRAFSWRGRKTIERNINILKNE